MARVSGDKRVGLLARYVGTEIRTIDSFAKVLNELSEGQLRAYAGEVWTPEARKALSESFALGDTLYRWFAGASGSSELLNLIKKALLTGYLSPPRFAPSPRPGTSGFPNPDKETSYVITSRDVSIAAAKQLALNALRERKPLYFILVAGNEDEMPYLAFQKTFADEIRHLQRRGTLPSSAAPNIFLYRAGGSYTLFYASFIGALMQMRGQRRTRVYLCESNADALARFENTLAESTGRDTKSFFRAVMAERLPIVGPLRLDERHPVSWVRPLLLVASRDANLSAIPEVWRELLQVPAEELQGAILRTVLSSPTPARLLRLYREMLCIHRYADGYFPGLLSDLKPFTPSADATSATAQLQTAMGNVEFKVYQLNVVPLLSIATTWEGIMGLPEATMMFVSLLRSHEVSDSFNIIEKAFIGPVPTRLLAADNRDNYARWVASEYLSSLVTAPTVAPTRGDAPSIRVARTRRPSTTAGVGLPTGLQPSSIGRQLASREAFLAGEEPASRGSASIGKDISLSTSSRSLSPSVASSSNTPLSSRSSLLSESSTSSPPTYHRD